MAQKPTYEELKQKVKLLEEKDIEDKQAEKTLEESETRFRTAIESLPFDFFVLDKNGRYVVQNSTCRERWGDIIGKRPEDLNVDGDVLRLWKSNNRRAFAGEVVEEEVSFESGGEEGYYHNIISPVFDDGHVKGILGVNIDITRSKRAEEALKKAHDVLERRVQERTAELEKTNYKLKQEIKERKKVEKDLKLQRDRAQNYLKIAGAIMVVLDADQKVTLINQRGCEVLGYSEEEVIGKNWYDTFVPKELRENVRISFFKIIAGELDQYKYYENPIVTKNGEERIISWQNSTMLDEKENVTSTLSSGEDITERKRAEEELRKFKIISEKANSGNAIVDLEDNIIYSCRFSEYMD